MQQVMTTRFTEAQLEEGQMAIEHFDQHCIENIRISIVNQKGGCGKTTTAVNLSSCLADQGYKVLLIDIDPQAQASLSLDVSGLEEKHTIYDVLLNNIPLDEAIVPTSIEGVDMVVSNSMLSGAEVGLFQTLGREYILKRALNQVLDSSSYHYVIIDCSPTLNLLTLNALVASHYTLIPFQAQYYSLEGMKELMKTVDIIRERLNPELEILGLLNTLFDQRVNISKDILGQVHKYFDEQVFKTKIRINSKLCEAPIYKKSIVEYDPCSQGAKDYFALAQEVIDRTSFRATKLTLRN